MLCGLLASRKTARVTVPAVAAGALACAAPAWDAVRLAQRHPGATLTWIKAHAGSRWNEYADALASSYMRDTL